MKPVFIGVATVALTTASVVAAQGHGNGNDHRNGGHAHVSGSMVAAAHGNGHGNAMQAAAHGNAHGHGNEVRVAAETHGNGHAMRPNGHDNGHGHANSRPPKPEGRHDNGNENGNAQGHAMAERDHGNANGHASARADAKGPPVRVLADGRRGYYARDARPAVNFAAARRGLINGCPPGLAKKNNGCMPPGLVRQAAWHPAWWGVNSAANGPYYYDNGYLVRMNGNNIAGYVPLLGGALAVGNPWPSYYTPMAVPPYYVNYYGLGPAAGYRYADNVIYRVDPTTAAITSVAALVTGTPINIGSPMPIGYDVYNVPYAYRTQYVDGPNAWYRYSDGYVYQIDPTTQLVTAAIELIAS